MPNKALQPHDRKETTTGCGEGQIYRSPSAGQASKDGSLVCSDEALLSTSTGVATAARRTKRRAGAFGVDADSGGTCQVPGCPVQLSDLEGFNLRCHICNEHRHAEVVAFPEGAQKRFCQQCNKFHSLDEFVGSKRGCEAKLLKHNIRQRKRRMQRRVREQRASGRAGLPEEEEEEENGAMLDEPRHQGIPRPHGVGPAGGRMLGDDAAGPNSLRFQHMNNMGDHRGAPERGDPRHQHDDPNNPYYFGGMEDFAAGWGAALTSAYPGMHPHQMPPVRRNLPDFAMGRGRQPSMGRHPMESYATPSELRMGMSGLPPFPFFPQAGPGPQPLPGSSGREYEMEWMVRAREWMQDEQARRSARADMPGVSSCVPSANRHRSTSPSANQEYVHLSVRIASMNPDMLPAEIHEKVLEVMHADRNQ